MSTFSYTSQRVMNARAQHIFVYQSEHIHKYTCNPPLNRCICVCVWWIAFVCNCAPAQILLGLQYLFLPIFYFFHFGFALLCVFPLVMHRAGCMGRNLLVCVCECVYVCVYVWVKPVSVLYSFDTSVTRQDSAVADLKMCVDPHSSRPSTIVGTPTAQ